MSGCGGFLFIVHWMRMVAVGGLLWLCVATGCCWLVVESIFEYWFVLDMMCLRRMLVVSIAKY